MRPSLATTITSVLLVAASERAQEVAEQASAGLAGILRMGAVTSAFSEVVPQILRRFRESRPLVELQVREIDTHHGRDALLRRELDVAVIRQAVTSRQLSSVPLRRDHFVMAMPDPPAGRHGRPGGPGRLP